MADNEKDRYEDPAERRHLRFEYRKLIADTEQNREDFVQQDSDGLSKALDKVDELFPKVRMTREAALDSQFLVLVSNLGHERAQHFQTGMVTFEPHTFAEKLVSFMGGRLVSDDESDDEEAAHIRRLENLDWSKLGRMAEESFKRTPTVEFMYGPVSMDAPVKKVRDANKRPAGEKPGSTERISPEQLVKVENNNEEATTKEVQRVLEALERVTDQGQDEAQPVYLFDFVTNPTSFSQTVENIFHLSFLINKGSACIELNKSGLPVVFPTDPYTEQDYDEVVNRKQVIMPFDMNDWKEIIEIYKIKKPMIPTREASTNGTVDDEDMEED